MSNILPLCRLFSEEHTGCGSELCSSVMRQRRSSVQRVLIWRSLPWRSLWVVNENSIINLSLIFVSLISTRELNKRNKSKHWMWKRIGWKLFPFSKNILPLPLVVLHQWCIWMLLASYLVRESFNRNYSSGHCPSWYSFCVCLVMIWYREHSIYDDTWL